MISCRAGAARGQHLLRLVAVSAVTLAKHQKFLDSQHQPPKYRKLSAVALRSRSRPLIEALVAKFQ